MSLEGAESVQVKAEPPWESAAGLYTGQEPESAQAGQPEYLLKVEHPWESAADLYTRLEPDDAQAGQPDCVVKVEYSWESRAGQYTVQEPQSAQAGQPDCVVKAEPPWENAAGLEQSGSAQAGHTDAVKAESGLYRDHVVKDELVVGPEVFQRPKVLLVRPASYNSAERNEVSGWNCSVRLERMHVDMKHRVCRIGHNTYSFQSCSRNHQKRFTRQTRRKDQKEQPDLKPKGNKRKLLSNKDTKQKPYRCDHCGYACALQNILKRHEAIHTGEKPYKCEHCNYTGALKEYLKQHMKVHFMKGHSREKRHKCHYCSVAFTTKHTLKQHTMRHTGEKPYKCDYCSYACAIKRSLLRHAMKHTGDKPYKCEHCSYASARKETWKLHRMKHTGDS